MRNERELSKEYDDLEVQIKETIIEIGTTKAWIEMLTSMTDSQNIHLKAWAKSVKNIGKGTGKNAARYRREAQNHMEHCIDAIPAWIMPLNQVFENFKIEPNLFDVVIIDEASQSWHDALLLKYITNKMIIVGDDKQISPTIIGVNDEDVLKLQHKYFSDINFLFGPDLNLKNSFFDICYIMFKETITLREHFRCMPEIIGFSNFISYRDKLLIPLRQYPADRLEPIKTVYLPEGVREGFSQNAINEVEAEVIVEKIEVCINDPRYADKSFGVICLQGSEVAGYRIDLVIFGDKTKLAVECDGDYLHTSPEDQERDFQRERVLQRAGWTFWRILGSTYYFNQVKALESLWKKLDEMGIRPYLEWVEDENNLFPSEEHGKEQYIHNTDSTALIKDETNPITKIEDVNIEDDKNKAEKDISQSNILKELKEKGYKVIDHRYISETVWLVGGEELRPIVEDFKENKVIFRYVEKGNSLTHYEPAWFAKMTPEKVKN